MDLAGISIVKLQIRMLEWSSFSILHFDWLGFLSIAFELCTKIGTVRDQSECADALKVATRCRSDACGSYRWQCHFNFIVLCATAGCDVSFEDHLQAKDPLLASVYWFHVYYTTRRILEELHITLPGDKSHSWYKNDYDARAYKRLCSEFGVSPDTDWRQKLDHWCQGLGTHTWHHHTNIGMYIKHKVYSSTQWTQSGITATFQRPGQHLFLTNQMAFHKRVWQT